MGNASHVSADAQQDQSQRQKRFFIWMLAAVIGGFVFGFGFLGLKTWLGDSSDAWKLIDAVFFANIESSSAPALGLFYLVGQLFMRAVQLGVVPLVFISIALAMLAIEETQKLGRIAFKSFKWFAILYLIVATCAVTVSYTASLTGIFKVNLPDIGTSNMQTVSAYNPLSILLGIVPKNIVSAMGDNSGVLAIIFLAVIAGLIMHKYPIETEPFKNLLKSVDKIITVYLDILIIKISPLCIFCLISRAFASYGTDFLRPAAAFLSVGVIEGPALYLIIYTLMMVFVARLNPIMFFKKTLQTALMASGTQSSSAALPINMMSCIERLGCSREISSFVLPTGMTVHMEGTVVQQVLSVTFIAQAAGIDIQLYHIILAALFALVMAVATPTVPMAGTTLVFVILTGLGFTTDAALMAYALVLAINYPVGMAVIPMNVVGDALVNVLVCKSEGEFDQELYNAQV